MTNNLKLPALSPTTKLIHDFSASALEITYSRPSTRGRHIFGEVVPFGKIWRTGANGVTHIKTHEDLEIAGQMISAGEYALYTIPNEHTWEVIINAGTGNWGTGGYNAENDVVRFMVPVEKLAHPCPVFTIDLADITFTTCNIVIMWDDVKIAVPVTAHNEAHINAQVDAAIEAGTAPYFQVATYYYEKQKDTDRAKLAIDKAIEAQPDMFYFWHLKAKIEKRLGAKAEAIAAVNRSNELVAGTPYEAVFHQHNQLVLADLN